MVRFLGSSLQNPSQIIISLHLQFSRLHGHLSDCIIHHQHCYRANLKQKTQPRKSENEQTEKILVVTSTTISSFNSETLVFPFESNWFHRSRKYRRIEWQMTLPLPLLFSVVSYMGYARGIYSSNFPQQGLHVIFLISNYSN